MIMNSHLELQEIFERWDMLSEHIKAAIRLNIFSVILEDSVARTKRQVRDTTLSEYKNAMKGLMKSAGNIDFQKVSHRHGEQFIQFCLDNGNSPATAKKKLKSLKRLFQMAVERGQLETNPLRYVRCPKVPPNNVRVYSEAEYTSMLRVASKYRSGIATPWYALIATALCTAMRRGELLNATWMDVDFEAQTINVSPKKNTEHTWEWHIKDNERRTLALTDDVANMLVSIQATQPEGCPYIFVPKDRYDRIQQRRHKGTWTVTDGKSPLNNFNRHFNAILKKAGIDNGEFHDLRRTSITGWLRNGLKEYEVMQMAGHSDFNTTRRFYLAVSEDLVKRARDITQECLKLNFGTHLARTLKTGAR